MVLILSHSHYRQPHEPFSFSHSTSSRIDSTELPSSLLAVHGDSEVLATTHQWSLPLRRELMGLSEPSTLLRLNDKPAKSHSTNGKSNLEVNTAITNAVDLSVNSISSASTMASEDCASSDAEDDDAMNGEDTDIMPKIEEDNDELSMEEIKTMESSDSPEARENGTTPAMTETRKKRGRPRKNPPASSAVQNKVAKGRSKTGCITCRRRKKKCDEAKPACK